MELGSDELAGGAAAHLIAEIASTSGPCAGWPSGTAVASERAADVEIEGVLAARRPAVRGIDGADQGVDAEDEGVRLPQTAQIDVGRALPGVSGFHRAPDVDAVRKVRHPAETVRVDERGDASVAAAQLSGGQAGKIEQAAQPQPPGRRQLAAERRAAVEQPEERVASTR